MRLRHPIALACACGLLIGSLFAVLVFAGPRAPAHHIGSHVSTTTTTSRTTTTTSGVVGVITVRPHTITVVGGSTPATTPGPRPQPAAPGTVRPTTPPAPRQVPPVTLPSVPTTPCVTEVSLTCSL